MSNLHAHAAVVPVHMTGLNASGTAPSPDFAADHHWHETLRDATQVVIRPLTRDDAAHERTFLDHLSRESLHYRFLGEVKVTDALIRQLVDVDTRREAAFIALREGHDEQIGAARFCVSRDGGSCEGAIVVSDEWQGKGLGYLMMRHLIEVARQAGIRRMVSIDSARNHKMRQLATDLGFQRKVDPDFPSEAIFTLEL